MKKEIKIPLIIITSIISVFLIFWIGIIIAWNWPVKTELRDVANEISPDGKYEAILQQVGDPGWPFGNTSLKITIKNAESNKNIEIIESSVADDGSNLFEKNWEVVWLDTSVNIILRGSEQKDVLHTIELE